MKIKILSVILALSGLCFSENIDPYNTDAQYGWSENTGWMNLEPSVGGGVQVASDKLTGWIWGENIGWISLSCENTGTCASVSYGVTNDGLGYLSGFAWAENVGWINFNPTVSGDPTHYGITIDSDGKFSGWAWGENIGWIKFDSTQSWNARACIVTIDDLVNFASYWLESGRPSVRAELDGNDGITYGDFNIFAQYWLDFCPDGWRLK
jgi:hypothetical protein